MKTVHTIYLAVLFSMFLFSADAQDVIRQAPCQDAVLRGQADSVRTIFTRQGYVVVREASVTMESEYEMPVVMPLTQGAWYQFVFIGDVSSKVYEVRMYDWSEKEVVYQKKMWGDVDGNVISYAYSPNFSEYHMMKPVQVNKKKKNLCGYVMLLKKVK
jgi:hypothetical protein